MKALSTTVLIPKYKEIRDILFSCSYGHDLQGKSDKEWRCALQFAQKDFQQCKMLHVEMLPLGEVDWDLSQNAEVFILLCTFE